MVAIAIKRPNEFYGTDDEGKLCIFPRAVRNAEFVRAFGMATKNIAFNDRYSAFPFSVKIGGSIVGIYSEGDSHADSDKQIMFRTNDFGLTYQTVTFYDSSTGQFDTSLLSGLTSPGDTLLFKVWTVENISGVLSVTTQSTVDASGLTYALWGSARPLSTGGFLRTGYAANGSNVQSGVFFSSDKKNWTLRSVAFSGAGRLYSESDIVNTTGTTWFAVCREDGGAGNPLYSSISTDNALTWTTPILLTGTSGGTPVVFNGRQPNLLRLSDNSILLSVGDRVGSSGLSSAGYTVDAADKTGIAVWRNTNLAAPTAWSFPTMIAGMYSTDGGQPYANETSPGRVAIQFYARRQLDLTPGIGSVMFNVENL